MGSIRFLLFGVARTMNNLYISLLEYTYKKRRALLSLSFLGETDWGYEISKPTLIIGFLFMNITIKLKKSTFAHAENEIDFDFLSYNSNPPMNQKKFMTLRSGK